MRNLFYIAMLCVALFSCNKTEKKLLIYAGSASKPATEEIVKLFEKESGYKVDVVFGGSGYVLSQMLISQKGDIFFPGSSDFMEIAKQKDAVIAETEKKVCFLISAINVQRGNPKGIKTLKDLMRPDVRVAIANPESVCVGTYAVEIVEKNFNQKEKELFRKKLVNYTGSCSKTATAISLKTVDAVLGWRVFENWDNKNIETIKLNDKELIRVGYIPVAVSKFSDQKDIANRFIDFLISEKGKQVFGKYNYFSTVQQAFDYIGTEKPIGGIYKLPEKWILK